MNSKHQIHVFINKTKYELESPITTGAALKALAGIAVSDVLFLQRPGDDEVVANDGQVTLKNGDHLHSQPPTDYGTTAASDVDAELGAGRAMLHPGSDGWKFLVLANFQLPAGFEPTVTRLLIKLPPTFPDAAPDMFWVSPSVRTAGGALPRATSTERLLGEDWQRFSWHLAPDAWTPGVSGLRDFLRCVAARFQRLD